MKRLVPKAVFVLSLGLFLCAEAHALTVLKGGEAEKYLGDIKQHILGGTYAYEILSRSHRDAMHGRFSDGLIFNTGGGNFLYPKRKNGEHIFVIDAPNGREEEPVTEDNWRQKIKNTLSDDNDIPYVFLDEAQKELAIVYVGKGTQVSSKMTSEGLLQIELEVEGARDARNSSRRRY